MSIEKYYPCPLCPRGQFLLKLGYPTEHGNFYSAECDRCKASFSINIPFKKED